MIDKRSARAAILASCEGDDRTLYELVTREGEQAALTALGISNSRGEEVLASCALHDIRLVIPGDDEWPTQLDQLTVPPLGLFVRGVENLRLLAARSVAIVGSRAASGYGVRVSSDIAAELGERGWSIISGLAFGIDAAAHRGALAVNASTAAVLAGGLDAIYPTAHTELGERVRAHGVLISEVAPGVPPMRHRFLTRNRIIAALTRGTLVVEAAHRSGSLRTAAAAEAMLRPVMAVPGSIHAPASAGVHQWIADRRAELVTSAVDVLSIIGDLNPAAVQPPLLSPREEEVLAALNTRPQQVDQIAHASHRAAADTMAALGVLALFGLAKQREGAWMRVQ
jgi:DNA processing protein